MEVIMKHVLKQDLYHEFLGIEKDIETKWPFMGNRFRVANPWKRELVEKAWTVADILKTHPYLSGEHMSEQTGLGKDHLAIIYKMIQRSSACQEYFKHSSNRDYFNVVSHYFNRDFYTLVFFVGTSCPSRCVYCPSVKIDSMGRRRLITYKDAMESKLSDDALERVFDDLSTIKQKGRDILVKISGGLEPLTDPATMEKIIYLSNRRSFPVKLFTNGLLLSDPTNRNIALMASDIRISLSTSDENLYRSICFPPSKQPLKQNTLNQLKNNIRMLVLERSVINPGCKIGFNSIILPDNHLHLVSLLEMARDLGIDYIDFKPNYFSSYDEKTQAAMDVSVREAKVVSSHESYKDLYVNFTGSLSRNDLFWSAWNGTCDAIKQSDFKLFITPYGHCSPVHYGAFPHGEPSFQNTLESYSMGEITPHRGLLDILDKPDRTPEIDLNKLNPFELMLNLEISREDADKKWGLPLCVSPYQTSQRDQIPPDLFFRFTQET